MRDPVTGLLAHGWDESKKQLWANPESGRSAHCYAWAAAQFLLALVEFLVELPEDHVDREPLVLAIGDLAGAVEKVQDRATGMWPIVLDQVERSGNYLETSASALLACALATGARFGILDPCHGETARRGSYRYYVTLPVSDRSPRGAAALLLGAASIARLSDPPPRNREPRPR